MRRNRYTHGAEVSPSGDPPIIDSMALIRRDQVAVCGREELTLTLLTRR